MLKFYNKKPVTFSFEVSHYPPEQMMCFLQQEIQEYQVSHDCLLTECVSCDRIYHAVVFHTAQTYEKCVEILTPFKYCMARAKPGSEQFITCQDIPVLKISRKFVDNFVKIWHAYFQRFAKVF